MDTSELFADLDLGRGPTLMAVDSYKLEPIRFPLSCGAVEAWE